MTLDKARAAFDKLYLLQGLFLQLLESHSRHVV